MMTIELDHISIHFPPPRPCIVDDRRDHWPAQRAVLAVIWLGAVVVGLMKLIENWFRAKVSTN